MKKSCILIAAVVLLSVATLTWAEDAPLVWISTHTAVAPGIDGKVDGVWDKAKPLTVTIREALGSGGPKDVILRALHTDDSFFVLAVWPDATRSDMRDPYLWNADTKEYERPTTPDDQFALEFPLQGEFQINMLPETGAYTADVWHWKAGRSNLGGWVDDKRHIISHEPIRGAKEYSMGGHNTVYVARPMDEGTASYAAKDKPTAFAGDVIPSYAAQKPSGSLTDVPGKGVHDGETWTLELSRKFKTGNADDATIDPSRDNICAIAVLNDELYWSHSISQKIILRFADEKSAALQASPNTRVLAFDNASLGAPGSRWHIEGTNQDGPMATWTIEADTSAPSAPNVLSLSKPNHSTSGTYNLCWFDGLKFKDGKLSMRFKANDGMIDGGGGPIWRAQDKDNYYVCRANPLEDNFRLYTVKAGKRTQLASAKLKIPFDEWHSITVVHKGNKIACYLNGEKLLTVTDDTFSEAGYVGLWTKADAATSFDDIKITSN